MVIGFTGPIGCGKTTAADIFSSFYNIKTVRTSFATPLKKMIASLLEIMGYENSVGLVLSQDGKATYIPELECTVRHLLQTVGTEWGREIIHPDIWVRITIANLMKGGALAKLLHIIDDVRFENEAAGIRLAGGYIVHIQRPGCEVSDAHASESGIEIKPYDYFISNDSSIERLGHNLKNLSELVNEREKPKQ